MTKYSDVESTAYQMPRYLIDAGGLGRRLYPDLEPLADWQANGKPVRYSHIDVVAKRTTVEVSDGQQVIPKTGWEAKLYNTSGRQTRLLHIVAQPGLDDEPEDATYWDLVTQLESNLGRTALTVAVQLL